MGDKNYSLISGDSNDFNLQAPPEQPKHSQMVITQAPAVTLMPVGPRSSTMSCPSCLSSIATRVEKKTTSKTHCCALCLCLFMMWPCACLPYCCDCFKNTDHYCPQCKAFLGTYQD